MRARTAVLVAAAVPVLKPQPRRSCPDCRGAGGWWVGGANPEMEACDCWATRRQLRIRLLPVPAWPDGPPF
ncbi:hypothetical protein ACWCRC_23885 [Streptomyces sp. NPDC001940]